MYLYEQFLLCQSSYVLIEISYICPHYKDVSNNLVTLSCLKANLILFLILWLDICLAANLQLIRSLSSGLKIRVCLSSSACTGVVGVAAAVCRIPARFCCSWLSGSKDSVLPTEARHLHPCPCTWVLLIHWQVKFKCWFPLFLGVHLRGQWAKG